MIEREFVHVPRGVLERLVNISAVTGAESRLYRWLLAEFWPSVLRQAGRREGFGVECVAGSQLAVHWTGNPQSKRRTMIVVHVDRDGYVLLPKVRMADGGLLLEAYRPWYRPLEQVRQGGNVVIVGGAATEDLWIPGQVKSVDRTLQGDHVRNRIVVAISDPGPARSQQLQALLAKEPGTVTAHHIFLGTNRLGTDPATKNVFAWGIDNAAGVAVATSVLSELVLGSVPVNATVVYTSGEKAGFTGILRAVTQSSGKLSTTDEDLGWIVVDCSDAAYSRVMGLDQWRRTRSGVDSSVDLSMALPGRMQRFPIHAAAIRLEDASSTFDLSMARMLYAAALTARARLLSQLTIDAKRGTPKDIQIAGFGLAGVFLGGRCEATVLSHLVDLFRALGQGGGGQHHVGSIAIPLLNFRNLATTELQLRAEEVSLMSLNAAAIILMSACRLHADYRYVRSDSYGFRLQPELLGSFPGAKAPTNRSEYVDELVARASAAMSADATASETWFADGGQDLVRDLGQMARR